MPVARAIVADTILAETASWETVEGNIYFPPSAIKDESLFVPTDLSTFCPWKGHASYYSVVVGEKTYPNAAWYYAKPYDAAMNIKDHVAFCEFTASTEELEADGLPRSDTSKVNVTVEDMNHALYEL